MRCKLTQDWPTDWFVHLPDTLNSCELIETLPNHVRLAMSRGKDALAAWIHLQAHGKTVDPVFYWLAPDIPFETTDLARLNQHFNTPIRKISHPSFWRLMREETYQPPIAVAVLRKLRIAVPTWNQLHEWLDTDLGVETPLIVCSGPRAADSSLRRMSVIRHGPHPRSGAWVVWDWKIAPVRHALTQAKLSLPVDYTLFGRSFDGISRQYMAPLAKHL
jgi:hypothetical protein